MTETTENRSHMLAQAADVFMENGGRLPAMLQAGCTRFTASLFPEPPHEPREVHFSMTWPSATLVCKRSLDGYSLQGGLHREGADES